MPRKSRTNTKQEKWNRIVEFFRGELPHLGAWWDDYDAFSEIRLKARDDGTVLAIAKGYDSGGGPVVCFGVGYDALAALLAVNDTMNANNWRVDKPWPGDKK